MCQTHTSICQLQCTGSNEINSTLSVNVFICLTAQYGPRQQASHMVKQLIQPIWMTWYFHQFVSSYNNFTTLICKIDFIKVTNLLNFINIIYFHKLAIYGNCWHAHKVPSLCWVSCCRTCMSIQTCRGSGQTPRGSSCCFSGRCSYHTSSRCRASRSPHHFLWCTLEAHSGLDLENLSFNI